MVSHKYKKQIITGIIALFMAVIGLFFHYGVSPEQHSKRYTVEYISTVDGDTAWFRVAGKKQKVRFIFIDTPEATSYVEPYGYTAANYTRKRLEGAKLIQFEDNPDGDKYDDYGRLLVWVFVDDQLLQEELAAKGYVKKFYDFGYRYTYKKQIVRAYNQAKAQHLGIYSQN